MVLTSAQIASYLDPLAYPIPIKLYSNPQPQNRRKYPSIEVDNNVPQDVEENYEKTTTRQRFQIHIYMRIKMGDTNETVTLENIETLIKTALDGVQIAGSVIYLETKSWNRNKLDQPVTYYDSILTISAEDIASTQAGGVLGSKIQLGLPGPISIQLLSEPSMTQGYRYDEDHDDIGSRVLTWTVPLGEGLFEYATTSTLDTSIKSLIDAKVKHACSITKNGTLTNFNAYLTETRKTAPYDNIERTVLVLQIVA